MHVSRWHRTLSTVLCLLLAAGTTTVSVRHSHEQGRQPHAHRLGLFSGFVPPTAPLREDCSGGVRAQSHSHFVVLGVEFYGGPTPPDAPPTPTADGLHLALGIVAVADGQFLPRDVAVSKPPCPPAGDLAPFFPSPSLSELSDSRPTYSAGRCALCERARGERSGVSRT